MIQAADGNFYGTTQYGGSNTCYLDPVWNQGCGTVFKLTPTGQLTTLHSFDGTDGWLPMGGLVQATNGNFYGTTTRGGATATSLGTVFEITPGGELTTLHSFDATDGSAPFGSLVQANDGNLYGTTAGGGPDAVYGELTSGLSDGTVFEITPEGELTTLHDFGGTDGAGPRGWSKAPTGIFTAQRPWAGAGAAPAAVEQFSACP